MRWGKVRPATRAQILLPFSFVPGQDSKAVAGRSRFPRTGRVVCIRSAVAAPRHMAADGEDLQGDYVFQRELQAWRCA